MEPIEEDDDEELVTEPDTTPLIRKLTSIHIEKPTRLETVKEVYEEDIVSATIKKKSYLSDL